MIETMHILLTILILLNVVFFFLGYCIGRLSSSRTTVESQPISFFSKQESVANDKTIKKVTIDETKYVTNIETSSMEKKYTSLGETKTSDENIGSSIDKLRNMKNK